MVDFILKISTVPGAQAATYDRGAAAGAALAVLSAIDVVRVRKQR